MKKCEEYMKESREENRKSTAKKIGKELRKKSIMLHRIFIVPGQVATAPCHGDRQRPRPLLWPSLPGDLMTMIGASDTLAIFL